MLSVDLNCDMGEGCPFDAELMKYISSVNVACGAHAGDDGTMQRTVDLAVENNVAIGAHPGRSTAAGSVFDRIQAEARHSAYSYLWSSVPEHKHNKPQPLWRKF